MNIQEALDFPRAFNLNGSYKFETTVPKLPDRMDEE